MALSDLKHVERNEAGIATALGILKQRFGERFQTGQAIREQHAPHHHLYPERRRRTAWRFPSRPRRCRRSCGSAPSIACR